MKYSIETILKITKGVREGNLSKDCSITQLLTDSRRLRDAEQTLFFALKTEKNNGSNYIGDLYQKEVRAFVIQDDFDTTPFPEACFIKVEDSLKALQLLVRHHRKQFDIPVVGITGSNGKTIVKEWLFELLKRDKQIVRNPRSYNSQIGVPLSVWMLEEQAQLGIFEAGISKDGEMTALEQIIQPTIGIFTNIGEAHQEGFMDYKHKISEKIKLFTHCETIIYSKDNQLIDLQFSKSSRFEDTEILTWSEKYTATLRIKEKTILPENTEIQAIYKNEMFSIRLPFTDYASYENLMHILLLMFHLGYDVETIQTRFSKLTQVAMRLEQKKAINDCILINDSYNSDIDSLNIALELLSQQYNYSKRTLILSDILQTGKDTHLLYKEVAEMLKQKNVNQLYGIGENISSKSDLFPETAVFFKTTDDFLNTVSTERFKEEAILIKGARKFEFERISNFLQNKNHETVLEVNLSHLIHNINIFHSKLKPNVKMMAMVKAFSYGVGFVEISNILQYHNIDYLAVAYADEGFELRKAGISLPIMVMNPEEMGLDQMIRQGLEPEIYNMRILKAYYKAVRRSGTVFAPMHIKIDTGMNRLGFKADEINDMIEFVQKNPSLKIVSVFSHLAGSDDDALNDFTNHQIAEFENLSRQIQSAFPYKIMRHISNSNGILRHPNAQFDMVRLGIGMYGISADKESALKPVSALKTKISQIKTIEENETIGYNRAGKLSQKGKIAIIPIGYADGIRRSLGNGKGRFWINGKEVPIVGNVCMDMCMLNVTGLDVKEGDTVEIFGENYGIENMAQQMGTIEYEVLTGISQRVKRVYLQE